MMMMMMIVDLYSALRRAPLLRYVSRCIVKGMSVDQVLCIAPCLVSTGGPSLPISTGLVEGRPTLQCK